jgi:tRNA pseudouridine38-40 synthase
MPENTSDFIYKMNAILPPDIAITSVYPVKADAHARYSAVSRTYKYTINTVKDPFIRDYAWFYPVPLDLNLLNRAASEILKFSDFKSFAKLHSDVKTHYCKVFFAEWINDEGRVIFTIRANRFLRNMVRAIVGTLIDIGRGKTPIDDLYQIIEGRERSLAGFSVPAQGLMLYDIEYPENIFLPV